MLHEEVKLRQGRTHSSYARTRTLKATVTRLLILIVLLYGIATSLHAQIINTGSLESGQSWTLTADGTFTVSGTGEVKITDPDVLFEVYGFRYFDARNIVFEEGITAINIQFVYTSMSLGCITLPSTVTSVNELLFYRAAAVFVNAETPPDLTNMAFGSMYRIGTVIVPAGTADRYRSSEWAKLNSNKTVHFVEAGKEPVSASVSVTTPGTLADEIAKLGLSPYDVESVTISGTLDASDFDLLKDDMPNLLYCDLSALSNTSLPVALFKDKPMLHCDLPQSLTSIPDSLFYHAVTMDNVVIPSGVTSIGEYALSGEVLSGDYAQVIPSGLESIGAGAFAGCRWLNGHAVIPDGMTSVPYKVFSNSNISGVTIPESVTSIGAGAFNGCDITDFTIPKSVDYIGDAAFALCPIDEITIPGTISSVGYATFGYCTELTEVSIPNAAPSVAIGDSAFFGCSKLESLSMPGSVGSVGNYAFMDCKMLSGISFSEEATAIGKRAFFGCASLTSVSVPESVTEIGESAFCGCESLTHIFIPEGVTMDGSPFMYWEINDGTADAIEIDYIKSPYPHLKTLIVRSDIKEAEYPLSDIVEYAVFDFLAADSLRVIEVPANMLNVNRDGLGFTRPAFDSVTVTAGSLDYKGFEFLNLCRSTLRYINLSKAENTELPDEALAECYRADSIALPANLERVGYAAFRGCMALKSIYIPASVSEIDDNAFEDCRSITAINFGGTEGSTAQAGRAAAPAAQSELRRIGNWAFYNCHQLQHLVIPEGVTEIGDAVFYGCTYLEDLELPSTVTRIGDNCFALCSKLKQIRVRAAVPPEIEAKTFYDVNREIPVYVPEDYLDDYREDPYWREFNLIGEDHGSTVGTERTSIDGLYRMEDGRIVLTEEMPVSVYTATGALVYSGMATEVALPAPGVYLLRIGGETVKVVRP